MPEEEEEYSARHCRHAPQCVHTFTSSSCDLDWSCLKQVRPVCIYLTSDAVCVEYLQPISDVRGPDSLQFVPECDFGSFFFRNCRSNTFLATNCWEQWGRSLLLSHLTEDWVQRLFSLAIERTVRLGKESNMPHKPYR
jgi:hypothetical protein